MDQSRKRLVEDFFEINTLYQRLFCSVKEQYLQKLQLSRQQIEVLYYIAEHQPLSIKDIAQAMQVTSSAATQIVESLVQHQFCKRVADEQDRRVVQVCLSDEGRRKFMEFKKKHIEKMNLLLDNLNTDELQQLIRLRRKTLARLQELEGKEFHGSSK